MTYTTSIDVPQDAQRRLMAFWETVGDFWHALGITTVWVPGSILV